MLQRIVTEMRKHHKDFIDASMLKALNASSKGATCVSLKGDSREIDVLIDYLNENGFEYEYFPQMSMEQTITIKWLVNH